MVECEKRVIELLEALETDPNNFSSNMKNFEDYYFGNKPHLNSNYIKRLFFVLNRLKVKFNLGGWL